MVVWWLLAECRDPLLMCLLVLARCCFRSEDNQLMLPRLAAILEGYTSQRPMTTLEVCWAAALGLRDHTGATPVPHWCHTGARQRDG